jgi:glycosyltransferase involved in cell wall biosynthesis
MGLTTLEAMSCELPVIVSDAGALPELAPDPDFGLVFSNEDELAGYLEAFASGAWPPPTAQEKARSHIVDNHGLVAIGRRLGRFYTLVHQEVG